MTYALEGVRAINVPMTPVCEQRIVWQRHDTTAGSLYLSPDCPDGVANKVLAFAVRGCLGVSSEPIGSGSFGHVWAEDGVAYKRAWNLKTDEEFGLSCLKANLCLSEGLRRIDQAAAPERTVHGRAFEITGPSYHAVLVPAIKEDGTGMAASQTFAMSREDGEIAPVFADLPASIVREHRYEQAVAEYGLNPSLIDWDDGAHNGFYKNLIIRPGSTPDMLSLVTIDAMAAPGSSILYPR
jgi:hypothetical protein